jgi:hypothetical protein
VLAYLLWHRPAEGVEREVYERALERFHRSLAHTPPAGFRGSAVYRVEGVPWLAPALAGDRAGGEDPRVAASGERPVAGRPAGERAVVYEDWYLLEDFTAVGVLNAAAVAHGHRTAHDEVARRFGGAAGGMYGLLEGNVDFLQAPLAVWVARPPGATQGALGELLGDGMDPAHASLWRRQLVLGPAPEYCLLADEPPIGVAPARLPEGWRATATRRETVWCGGRA